VITNGRKEVHARTLTSACKSGIAKLLYINATINEKLGEKV